VSQKSAQQGAHNFCMITIEENCFVVDLWELALGFKPADVIGSADGVLIDWGQKKLKASELTKGVTIHARKDLKA